MTVVRVGATLGQYKLVRAIGSGGMGIVYEARHVTLRRRAAVKVLHTRSVDCPDTEKQHARFLREGRAAAKARHPHVVDVVDFGVHDGTPYLVMELVEGASLEERLDAGRPLPLATVAELLLPVISAVAELHAAGVVHRDLKPANILIATGRDGQPWPKLSDFGVSRMDGDGGNATQSGVMVGTLAYMAPEQARAGKDASARSDQYALGVILYRSTTGEMPFHGEPPWGLLNAIMNDPLVSPRAHVPSLPEAFEALVLRAMSRDPNARFESMDDLGAALLAFATPDVAKRWASEFAPPAGRDPSATRSPTTWAQSRRAERPARAEGRARAWTTVLAAAAVAAVVGSRLVTNARSNDHEPAPSSAGRSDTTTTTSTTPTAAVVAAAPSSAPRPALSTVSAVPPAPSATANVTRPAPPPARAPRVSRPPKPLPAAVTGPPEMGDNGSPILAD